MNNKFEKPRKGNEFKLTVNQHVHSAFCISKFHNQNKKVELYNIKTNSTKVVKKDAKIFVTKRNWTEKAEKVLMYKIEKDFYDQINNLGSKRDHEKISKYFCLWLERFHFHHNRIPPIQYPKKYYDQISAKQAEYLESKHIGFFKEDSLYSSREITSSEIRRGIDRFMTNDFKNVRWGLIEATEGEFLCADNYFLNQFIPISPKHLFHMNVPDEKVSFEIVARFNKMSIQGAREFYFAKDLKACPIIKENELLNSYIKFKK